LGIKVYLFVVKIKKSYLILGLWIVVLVLINVVYLSLDRNPPAWDQAAHIKGIVNTNLWLRGEFWGGFKELINSFWGYPPLMYFLGGLWSSIVGVSIAKISFLNTIVLVVGIFGVYKLAGETSKKEGVGVLAAIIFSLIPVISDISRNMLLDLTLTVLVAWGLYFWIKSEDLSKNNYAIGLLLTLIFASLVKLNGFLYFGAVVLWILLRNYKKKEVWGKLMLGGLLYAVWVGWWWILNWQNNMAYLGGLAGQGEVLTDPMNLASFDTWIHYFRLFFLNQMGAITTIMFLLSLLLMPKVKENKKFLFWLVFNYILLTVIRNKDFRFTMPLLPLVATYFAWGLFETKRKWVIGVVLLWMGFNVVENSFNWPMKKPVVVYTPTFLMGNVNWVNFSDYPMREYRSESWPNEEILGDIPKGKREKVLVLINIAEMNDNTLGLYSLLNKRDVEIHGVFEWGQMDFDYIILPDLKTESAPFYDTMLEVRKEAINEIWGNMERYEIRGEYELPNKGKVYPLETKIAPNVEAI